MNISLLTGLLVTGLVGFAFGTAQVLIGLRKKTAAVKIAVRVRPYRQWKG